MTGALSKDIGNKLNLKHLENLGEQLEDFSFKEEVIDKIKTDTLGPIGATIVRAYFISCIPLFIKMKNYMKELRSEGYKEEEIQPMLEKKFSKELKELIEKIDSLEDKLKY